ncbi:MAG: sugar phosphate nucleotidyltransferase [Planctomycetota bacterium]
MAGGSGTRFWPASRLARPKQFLRVIGDRSLLQGTVDRLAPLVPPERVLVIGARAHVELVHEQLPEIPRENVLGEPCARGTLPCAAWAAAVIGRRDPNAVFALLPADHVIAPAEAFRATLQRAHAAAHSDALPVVFGIRPSYPATGFGWIETREPLGGARAVVDLARFVEKPDATRATEFLASGRFSWNGGVFVWSVRTIDALLAAHAPQHRATFAADAVDDEAFGALPNESIDVGIMERVTEARVVDADFTWSDVGSWNALAEVLEQDAVGNCAAGGTDLVAVDSAGCVVHGPAGSLTALVGVEGLIVARDGDAVLVARIDRAQDVRKVVEELKQRAPERL